MKAFPRDIEVATMKERHVGIENELIVTTGRDQLVPPTVGAKLKERGLLNSVGYDGGGREFRTNPISLKSLLHQVRGAKYLCEYYDTLKTITEVADTGGTHLHISILNTDHPLMESNATALGLTFFNQFQKIAGRKSSWARKFGYNRDIRTIQQIRDWLSQHKKSDQSRAYYLKGSILGPTGHQTLEFRGPKGSNDKNEVLAWAEFLENVVKAANRESIEGVQFGQLLEGDHISSYVASLTDWRGISERELGLTFRSEALQ